MDTVEARITAMTDEQLLEIVEIKYNDYTLKALSYAMEELKRRNIPFVDQSANYALEVQKPEATVENNNQGEAFFCSQCKKPMTHGNVYLEDTISGSILLGFSYKHCYFSPKGDGKKEMKMKVIDNDDVRKAYYCRRCGLITFKLRG